MAKQNDGFTDTPLIPGSTWRVHDAERPEPRAIDPGMPGTQKRPGRPPSDAVVLFDGTDLSTWQALDGSEAKWKVENGYVEVVPHSGNILTKEEFGDCQLHVEWCSPTIIEGEGQGRGNSGVFLMGKYEIQVLDCYRNPTYADGLAGGVYGEYPPMVNACRAPGEWQAFDIVWVGPRFDGERLLSPARVTVIHTRPRCRVR